MDILTSITTALATLKTGFEIKKLAGNLDSEIQQGELRVEIRKLQESLIDVQDVLLKAKREILGNRDLIQKKDTEIKRLKTLLSQKSSRQLENIPDESIKILELLSKVSEPVFLFHIAQVMQIPSQKTKYFLDELEKAGFVDHNNLPWEQDETYSLNEEGRKYLFETL